MTDLAWVAPDRAAMIEDFLATLVDRVVCESTEPPIVAALQPLAAAMGIEVRSPIYRSPTGGGGIGLTFNPGLPVAAVAAAFRWELPVGSQGDHRTASAVGPLECALGPPWAPILGRWWLDVRLHKATWPRGPGGVALPLIERGNLSPVYDLRGCENTVHVISLLPGAAIQRPED